MHAASISFGHSRQVAPVPRRIFGSFVEHLGRAVYTGIYEPGHPDADEDGFRRDVLRLVRELGVTVVRYPGGNFVSGYRWEDGVGPRADRPRRLDLAWHSLETNEIGLDEFMRWAGKANVEPMLAVNLGTRGVQEAVDLLEYANHGGGTRLSDRRRANGAEKPHGIRLWCLGNEMDGPWQTGHKTAMEYGRLAAETARAMRQFDPTLELVACGSSSSAMPSFLEWERVVLQETIELVDMISCHAYYAEEGGVDLASFLASAEDMDYFITSVTGVADSVAAAKRIDKRVMISFDEWNVWYQKSAPSVPPSGEDWPVAPRLLEDNYNLADAVVVGGLLICLLRHSDRVAAACLAQLVNVIAPIMTEPGGRAWRQTTFHPFSLTSRHARGAVLSTSVTSTALQTERFGSVRAVDAVATWDEATREVATFIVNRDPSTPARVEFTFDGDAELIEALTFGGDPYARNTLDDPDRVEPAPNDSATTRSVEVPGCSWSCVRFRLA
ncbi:alpha-N-arabinofuranosidase [Microbispora sp. NPDC046933]|uniref:arabinosylfuranosidase ArfA n=1 Tax=Microbispora sp. NPDC046933 TaxID=3155618 RepID=UPI003409D0E9